MGRWADKRQKYTVSDEIYRTLSGMLEQGKGRSRHEDKIAGIDGRYIYSTATYKTYKRECQHFRDWLKAAHPDVKHLKQGKQYVNDYLQSRIDAVKTDGTPKYSAYTISTGKAALSKLYGLSGADLIPTPARHRADIKRSRYAVEGDKHISAEKQEYYGKIGRATGLRRQELTHITGDALFKYSGDWYGLHVTERTKGGKPRTVLIHGRTPEETKEVVELFKKSGHMRVCPTLPSHFDEHACRAEYARNLYNAYARKEGDIPKADRYICRKDRAGLVLDKQAMRIVSRMMGHNRIDVIAQHYLWT